MKSLWTVRYCVCEETVSAESPFEAKEIAGAIWNTDDWTSMTVRHNSDNEFPRRENNEHPEHTESE